MVVVVIVEPITFAAWIVPEVNPCSDYDFVLVVGSSASLWLVSCLHYSCVLLLLVVLHVHHDEIVVVVVVVVAVVVVAWQFVGENA